MKKIIMSFLALGLFVSAFAQTTTTPSYKKRPTLSVNFFLKDFKTPDAIGNSSLATVLKDNTWAKVSDMSPGLNIQYFEGLSEHFDFMATLGGTFVDYPFLGRPKVGQDKFLLELDANLNVKLLSDKHFFVPFLSAGVGASMYGGNYFGAYIPVGAGFQFNLGNSESFLFTQFTYKVPVTTATNNYNFNYSLGFGSPLTEKKVEKLIPPPPPPVVRQEPKDTDKDGIYDSVDKCPTVFGVVKYQGCPVPDTDKDGINDEEDKCPTVAGPASNGGCPLPKITEEKKKRVNENAKNIYFQTGKAVLLKKSFKSLDDVVALLKEEDNATLGLDIEGHTDNVGKDLTNQKLSDARAKSVSNYLKKKGIDASRLSSVGYGESKPVVDNKTSANRAKNRRVEMKLKEM